MPEKIGGLRRPTMAACGLAMLVNAGPATAEGYVLSPEETELLCTSPGPDPFIVIAGSTSPEVDQGVWNAQMIARIEACGDWWWAMDDTVKYPGLRPGLHFGFIGVFDTRAEAERARRTLSRCIPDAYIRQTCWYGE